MNDPLKISTPATAKIDFATAVAARDAICGKWIALAKADFDAAPRGADGKISNGKALIAFRQRMRVERAAEITAVTGWSEREIEGQETRVFLDALDAIKNTEAVVKSCDCVDGCECDEEFGPLPVSRWASETPMSRIVWMFLTKAER